jgi:hypothetical protein
MEVREPALLAHKEQDENQGLNAALPGGKATCGTTAKLATSIGG